MLQKKERVRTSPLLSLAAAAACLEGNTSSSIMTNPVPAPSTRCLFWPPPAPLSAARGVGSRDEAPDLALPFAAAPAAPFAAAGAPRDAAADARPALSERCERDGAGCLFRHHVCWSSPQWQGVWAAA